MKRSSFLLKLLFLLALFHSSLSQARRPPRNKQPRGRSGRAGSFLIKFIKRTTNPPPGQPMPPPPTISESEESEGLGHCSDEEPKCINFFNQRFPTANGDCNNRVNPRQGAKERSFKRYIEAQYNDGHDTLRVSVVRGRTLPSARQISNILQGALSTDTPFTQMLPFWGQFLVHDIALTLEPTNSTVECECNSRVESEECINIPIPPGDKQFRSDVARRRTCLPTERSVGVADSEDCLSPIRQQLNEISGYLDMGIIYGNSDEHLTAIRDLRSSRRGELIEVKATLPGIGTLLPDSNFGPQITPAASAMFCPEFVRRPPQTTCRVSGEARTNENSVLQSHHTVWMITHNIVVRQLRRLNPLWSSDRLLQVGKLIVTALHQRVTYEHFLPIILGSTFMRRFDLNLLEQGFYYGYESSYSAGVSNSFATAAFRMGHALINELFTRPDNTWTRAQGPSIRVRASLFNIGAVTRLRNAGGVNSFIRGLANQSAIRFDPTFPDDLRNFLFAPNFAEPGAEFGADLLARNIQRGRDHGLPTYSQTREFCGLPALEKFSDLLDVMTAARARVLQQGYADVRDIDLYAGGVSETAVDGGVVGPTFACLIAYQFRDLKKGDRFWHENPPPIGSFTPGQLAALRKIPFPRLLCEMVDGLQSIQPWPLRKVGENNLRRRCSTYPALDLSAFREPEQTNFLQSIPQSTKGTKWFPTSVNIREEPLTVSELYQWLLIHRPTEVCRQVTSSKIKMVRGREQVRFRCLPGTIRSSDFPPVLSDRFFWSNWFTGSASPTRNDYRVTPDAQARPCEIPYAFQAQTLQGVPAGETKDVFNRFSPTEGLICLGRDQESRSCSQYRIRYLCRKG